MRSLSSLLHTLKLPWKASASPAATAALPAAIDSDALWRNAAYFWSKVDAQCEGVRRAMYERYPLVSRTYVDRYFDHILSDHRLNPLALLYIESELGAPARQIALLEELERGGIVLRGRRCLDIGCSNGSLLLAAAQRGAVRTVGVDVSEARLSSAHQLCEGSAVELLHRDIATVDLPSGWGPFDLIFCTDVLEHVASIPDMLKAMARHLAPGPAARAVVTLFNRLSPACVLSEPHYDIPGMVLLDHDIAEEIWLALRVQLKSTLDYEVGAWPDYASIVEYARDAGLKTMPHLDASAVLQGSPPFWSGYAERLEELRRAASARLDTFTLSPAHRVVLADSVDQYCNESVTRHREFEARLRHLSEDDVLAFYMRYYAQPIRALLSHA
jgi:2-polyprenyl-3-methyl-5-hydroxy-6-metoxy-1,4-benzoquinol methylase